MKKLVYILSSPHAGSTFLSLALASHTKMLALGEVYRWLHRGKFHERYDDEKEPCSCGKTMAQCDFWKDYQSFHKTHRYDDISFKYNKLFELAEKKYGKDTIIVDASKTVPALIDISKDKDLDIRVIFLLKDMRSLTVSNREKDKFIGKKLRPAVRDVFGWFRRDWAAKKILEKGNYNFFQVGYEEIALYPDYILPKICEFIGIEYEASVLKPSEGGMAHYAMGNRMRFQKEKKKRIFYDNRWFCDWSTNFALCVLYPIFKWNADNVYKNTRDHLWKWKKTPKVS